MKERVFAVLLSLCLLAGALPVAALAAEENAAIDGADSGIADDAAETVGVPDGEGGIGEGVPAADSALDGEPDSGSGAPGSGDADVPGGAHSTDEEIPADVPVLYGNPAPRAADVLVGTVDELKTALNSAVSDTTIQLTADIGEDANRLSGVILNKDIKLTLDLNGHELYVTGNQTSSGVLCAITQSKGSLEVISSNGQGSVNCEKGGFLKQSAAGSTLTVTNVDFLCGTTTNSILYLCAMSEATLTDCSFTGGKDVPYPYYYYNGSVSYLGNTTTGKDSKTKLTVTNCHFTNNHTGIALSVNSMYDISITDSAFTGCDFGISQNEEYNNPAADLKMNISNTAFRENSHGLCLTATSYNKDTVGSRDVTITGCTFEKNEVTTPVKISGTKVGDIFGAAIYYRFIVGKAPYYDKNYQDNLTISDCTFTENHAEMSGGALYIDSALTSTTAKISDCTFTGNEGGSDGEAIDLENRVEHVTIEGCTISDSPTSYNAAINVSGGQTELLNCDIKNNGRGIMVLKENSGSYGTNVTLEGVQIENNRNCGIRGAFSTLTVKDSADRNSVISGNQNGGLNISEGNITIQGSTKIEDNTSGSNGAGICMSTKDADNASLSLQDNVSIQGNRTSKYAGGIYMQKGTLDVGDNVIFCNNTADSAGADIWYTGNVTSVTLPDPANMNQKYLADGNGETITGWYQDYNPRYAAADPKVPVDYTEHIGTGDVLLVAAYTPVTKHAVSFDLNYEGAPAAEVQQVKAGQCVPRPTPDPEREGWAFQGWYTEASDGELYDFSAPVTADTALYAHWAEEHTVTYVLGEGETGAEGGDYGPSKVKDGDFLTLAAAPTKDGYTFTGWSDGAKTYQPGNTLAVTGDITLTAQWSKNGGGSIGGGDDDDDTYYTLHYESNGGTRYRDERYAEDTVVKLNKFPTREGYVFAGWYADEELTEPATSVKMTKNETVYALWRPAAVPGLLNGSDHFAYVVGYPDGTVRPMNNISRAQVATIFFRLLQPEVRAENLTTENTFTDVNAGMWCNTAVSTMAKLGIVLGRTPERFDPDAAITRAEFAVICARFDTSRTDGGSNFTDIENHWAKAGIERAVSLGWIRGYTDGTFRPDRSITRAEAMTMINRMLCRIPEDEDDLLPDMNVWLDNRPGDGHYLAVQEATNSHDFRYKGEIYEYWTELNADPDWTRYQN